ncbi:hypothetical protein VTN77DRAFT_1607 [Rasamsonia byssochlamydoides]|uniref:uncharacterized protein n=1 Tax=Rasamsonia byssochlamydoides TaxID=89139 RepID=UPI0037444A3E
MTDPARGEAQSQQRPKKTVSGQSRSCRVCRIRKVKCDRVKPCRACCAHGHPSKCVYDIGPGDEEFQPISQADEIRNLRNELKELRAKISRQGDTAPGTRRLAELERLFDAIRSAPINVVDDLIGQIRANHRGPARRGLLRSGSSDDDASDGGSTSSSGSMISRRLPLRRPPYGSFSPSGSEDSEQDEYDFNTGKSRSSTSLWEDSSSTTTSSSSSTTTITIDDDLYLPLSRFVSNKPALDVFVQRFVDSFSPEVDTSSGRAGALRAAAGIRMFSPMITNAFEAVSLTFFGRSVQDPRIESAGLRLYPRTLRSLQEALLDPERSRSEATLVTVTLLLAFESIERTSQKAVAAHAMGAMRLMQHRGPESLMYGVEHLIFTELRPYWVGAALVDRKPTVFNEPAWKTVPWSAGTTEKDLLHHLLDLAVEIPELLWKHDQLAAAQQSQILGRAEVRVKQADLWNGVGDLTDRFLQFKKDWIDCYPGGAPQETVEPQGPDAFPVFRCYDLRTMKVIVPPTLVYPDLRLLQTVCVYAAYRLILSTIDTRPEGAVTMAEKYQLACDIARSLECYIRRAPGNMINRLALPVRVAWEAFPPGGVERDFMRQVFALVEQRHALRLWGSSMPELSPRAGAP